MRKKVLRIVSLMLVILSIACSAAISAQALSWDGNSANGGGGGTAAGKNGYAVRTTDDNCIGYRFSIVNKNGANKVSTVIDVFRNTTYGNYEYSRGYKFTSKYNKKQLIGYQNSGFSTSANTSYCYTEAGMGFATTLPTPSGMGTWQNNTTNLNRVLAYLGAGNLSGLKNGDKILVEPIYDVRLESVYHALTVTEIALYGKYKLGANSNGGSSGNPQSWGFISEYVNRHYPNSLYTPDGQGLWTGVGSSGSRITFYNIINQGYGVGIAYTETKPDFSPALNVLSCDVFNMKYLAGERSGTHLGATFGNTFENYRDSGWTSDYPTIGDSVTVAIRFSVEDRVVKVRQYVKHGGNWRSRDINITGSDSSTYFYYVQFDGSEGGGSQPTNLVEDYRQYYWFEAKQDWLDASGNVIKSGAVKSFYVPVKPKTHNYKAAAYSITGDLQAYDSEDGAYSSVYVGQRINFQYSFTNENTWDATHYLRGRVYRWDNSSGWVAVKAYNPSTGDADLYEDDITMNKSAPRNTNSTLGLYTVPDNSANTNGSNRIPIYTWSHWAKDIDRTTLIRWFNIPIVKADVELYDIGLTDEDGYFVDQNNLEAGQNLTVYYQYKNNTNCTVYVNGYNSDRSQINGIYSIPANGTVWVKGYSFEVPNEREFSVWGGVYLEGAGIYNTSYETDGTNNSWALNCKVNHPVKIVPITPNAPYRENTWVISSFWLNNIFRDNYIPDNNISIKFSVYNSDDRLIASATKTNQIVPGNDKNLVYFNWRVPSGMYGDDVRVEAELIENSKSYNKVSNYRSTMPNVTLDTPDTQFEESAPVDFSASTLPVTEQHYATWWEYRYENGQFRKVNYGIGIYTGGTHKIEPATGSTATQNGSEWTMKSGYGISLQSCICMVGITGYESPNYWTGYTSPQYGYALFPEYNYRNASNTVQTLSHKLVGVYDNWVFPTTKYGAVHFTPVWYPDGKYTVKVVESDSWTPAGMLTTTNVPKAINISGNMYDDWYVGR